MEERKIRLPSRATIGMLGTLGTAGALALGLYGGRAVGTSTEVRRQKAGLEQQIKSVEQDVNGWRRFHPPSEAHNVPRQEAIDRFESIVVLQSHIVDLKQTAAKVDPRLHRRADKLLGHLDPYRTEYRRALLRRGGDR